MVWPFRVGIGLSSFESSTLITGGGPVPAGCDGIGAWAAAWTGAWDWAG